jgi:hypothetical protein
MTEQELAAIELADKLRTPGEWTAYTGRSADPVGDTVSCQSHVAFGPERRWSPCTTDFLTLPAADAEATYPVGPNAAFIAACSVDVPRLCAALRAARTEIDRLRHACATQNHEVCQLLGVALRYPRYADDPANFPDATEACGVCVGEHTAETLACEAARELGRLRADNAELRAKVEDAPATY